MSSPNLPMVIPETRGETGASLEPLFHLVLLDDNDHSYDYVVRMLGDLFGYGPEKAFALARLVDTTGRVIVETAAHERACADQQRIHRYGPDPLLRQSRGSMSAVVEPVP